MIKHVDYYEKYGRIMQFNKNKKEPFHRWYPFVEGYSREFIQSILEELGRDDIVCLEPFAGSGTTALELQMNGIPCYSFEVNPLMMLISKVKLENEYDSEIIKQWHKYIIDNRKNAEVVLSDVFPTLYENGKNTQYNYSADAGIAVNKLNAVIQMIPEQKYKDLFTVALAAILLDVSNMYRNGKCLSYKKHWDEKAISEDTVFQTFDSKISNEIIEDIATHGKNVKQDNKSLLFGEDCRVGIENYVADDSIDLVITSPPYLNSRDYTDTYMLELKTLGFTRTLNEIRKLREKTIRSHVQVKWNDNRTIENELLNKTLKNLKKASEDCFVWNSSVLDMVRLYFVDMQTVFQLMYKKMKFGGKVYFNVSNSAYYNVLVDTLEICALIASDAGFNVIEIRDARKLKTSPQQKDAIGKLLEGVIVMEKGEKHSA